MYKKRKNISRKINLVLLKTCTQQKEMFFKDLVGFFTYVKLWLSEKNNSLIFVKLQYALLDSFI